MDAYAEQTENKIVIKVSGRIDSVTCEDFRSVVAELDFGEKA